MKRLFWIVFFNVPTPLPLLKLHLKHPCENIQFTIDWKFSFLLNLNFTFNFCMIKACHKKSDITAITFLAEVMRKILSSAISRYHPTFVCWNRRKPSGRMAAKYDSNMSASSAPFRNPGSLHQGGWVVLYFTIFLWLNEMEWGQLFFSK